MKIAWFGFLLLVAVGCVGGEDGRLGPRDGLDMPPSDPARVQLGAVAPDFTLESKDGESVSLSSFRGKKNVVMVFYRGYW